MPIPCSRNARPKKGLVRRPQWDPHGCPSWETRRQASIDYHAILGTALSEFQLRLSSARALKLAHTPALPAGTSAGYGNRAYSVGKNIYVVNRPHAGVDCPSSDFTIFLFLFWKSREG